MKNVELSQYGTPLVEVDTAYEQAVAHAAANALKDAARAASGAVWAARDAVQVAADAVALAAARNESADHSWCSPTSVYSTAFRAAEEYIAECPYTNAGDDECYEGLGEADLPRYLMQERVPSLDSVAHNAACYALAVVSRERGDGAW